MKKAIKLAVIYLIILILGTVLGTILYSFYLNLLGFVAGREIIFFKDEELFKSLFYVSFCMLIFILPLVSYYRMRHPGGVLQLIVYIVLCVLTWGLLMPGTIKLRDYCNRKISFNTTTDSLSPHYFRKVDEDVYYFTREFRSNTQGRAAESPAIIIDTSEDGNVEFRSVADYPSLALNRKAEPFREIQLKNIFGEDKNPVPVDFRLLFSMITGAYSGGLTHLLTLFSFVLLLCSVYGITSFFDWRLLNAVILYITTTLVFCLNTLYFMPQFHDLKIKIMSNGFFRAFGGIVSEPILFLINCLFALLFISAGIIKFAVRKHARKAR
jgi:hypothetical protein